MPFVDEKLKFSENQAITTNGANDSTNVINLGQVKDKLGNDVDVDPGNTEGLWLNVMVNEAVASGSGDSTVAVKLQDSTDGSTWADTEISVAAVAKATLVAGYRMLRVKLPVGLAQYLKLVYTVGGTGDLTAGKFTSWVGMETIL